MNNPIETIEIHGEEPRKLKFPAAYRNAGYGYTVLFTALRQGTVVTDATGNYEIGYCAPEWTPCDNPEVWTPVHLVINNPNV